MIVKKRRQPYLAGAEVEAVEKEQGWLRKKKKQGRVRKVLKDVPLCLFDFHFVSQTLTSFQNRDNSVGIQFKTNVVGNFPYIYFLFIHCTFHKW